MTKRQKILIAATVCLLILSALAIQAYRTILKGGALDAVAQLVPDDAFLFVASRGAGDLSLEFSEMGVALSEAGPHTQAAFEVVTDLSSEFMGFNPLTVDGWESSGLSFFHPIGYATFGAVDALRGDALILLPIGDKEALIETVTHMVESLGGVVNLEELPSRQIWETHGARLWGKELNLAWILEDDYLIASLSLADGFTPVPKLMAIYDEDESLMLSELDSFVAIADSSSGDWHNFGYVSTAGAEDYSALMSRGAANFGLPIPPVLPSKSFGFYTHFNDDHISASLIVSGLSDAFATTISPLAESGRDQFSESFSIAPIIIGRLSLSIEEIWESTIAYDPSIEAIATSALLALGVNFDEDVLQNMTGDTSFIVASEMAPDGFPTAVVHSRLRRGAPLEAFLQTACPMLLTHLGFANLTGDGFVACESEMGSFGIAENHIIASNNPALIRGDFGSSGLSENMPQEAWIQQQNGAPFSVFVNVRETAELLLSGALADTANTSSYIPRSVTDQLAAFQPGLEVNGLPFDGLGMTLTATGDVMEITGHIYPANGSLTGWVQGGLELLLTPTMQGPSVNMDRELAAAVESLAGMVTVYQMFEDRYLPCGSDDLAAGYRLAPTHWQPDEATVACLEGELEWSIDEAPSGAYWVTLVDTADSKQAFLAHGLALNGEEFIYFQAGPNGQAVRIVQ